MTSRAGFFVRLAVMAVCSLAIAASSPAATDRSQAPSTTRAGMATSFRMGIDNFFFALLARTTELRGDFARNDVAPTFSVFASGTELVDGILAGRLDMGIATDFSIISRLGTGNLRIAGALASAAPKYAQLIGARSISRPSDLVGKRIGFIPGSQFHYYAVRYLRINKIPTSRVTFVSFPSFFDIVAALRSGRVDAGWFAGPAIQAALSDPNAHLITDGEGLKIRAVSFLVVDRSFLARNPGTVVKVLASFRTSLRWMNANKRAAVELACKPIGCFGPSLEALYAAAEPAELVLTLNRRDYAVMENARRFARAAGLLKDRFRMASMASLAPIRRVLGAKAVTWPAR